MFGVKDATLIAGLSLLVAGIGGCTFNDSKVAQTLKPPSPFKPAIRCKSASPSKELYLDYPAGIGLNRKGTRFDRRFVEMSVDQPGTLSWAVAVESEAVIKTWGSRLEVVNNNPRVAAVATRDGDGIGPVVSKKVALALSPDQVRMNIFNGKQLDKTDWVKRASQASSELADLAESGNQSNIRDALSSISQRVPATTRNTDTELLLNFSMTRIPTRARRGVIWRGSQLLAPFIGTRPTRGIKTISITDPKDRFGCLRIKEVLTLGEEARSQYSMSTARSQSLSEVEADQVHTSDFSLIHEAVIDPGRKRIIRLRRISTATVDGVKNSSISDLRRR